MILQNLQESFWKNTKFFLIFLIATSLIYIVLTKWITRVPVADNNRLLSSIAEFENVLEIEKDTQLKIISVGKEIKELEFDIYQVQRQDDIRREIYKIRSIYNDNNMNSKYLFSLQLFKILEIYYDTREKNSALINNSTLLLNNLTECEANI